jgi:hypothetical protein
MRPLSLAQNFEEFIRKIYFYNGEGILASVFENNEGLIQHQCVWRIIRVNERDYLVKWIFE